jgi:hypothetical protein
MDLSAPEYEPVARFCDHADELSGFLDQLSTHRAAFAVVPTVSSVLMKTNSGACCDLQTENCKTARPTADGRYETQLFTAMQLLVDCRHGVHTPT